MFRHAVDKPIIPDLIAETSETGRVYSTPTGEKYPSITTVLGHFSKSSIIEWQKKIGIEEANKISTQAARRGTAIHSIAEDYLNNKDDWCNKLQPINLYTFNSLRRVIDNHINMIYYQEQSVYSHRLKTAGRMDCLAEWDGELAVIDFKTSRKPKKKEWIEDSYYLQVSFYAAALYEIANIKVKKGVVLVSVDNDDAQVFEVDVMTYLPRFIELRKQFPDKD